MVGTSTLRGQAIQRTKYSSDDVAAIEVNRASGYNYNAADDGFDETHKVFHQGADTNDNHFFYSETVIGSSGVYHGTHTGKVIKLEDFEGTTKEKYTYGDVRCIARLANEHGYADGGPTAGVASGKEAANKVYLREKFEETKDQSDTSHDELLTSEVLVPRTCLMWGSGFLDGQYDAQPESSSANKQQCDEWFRDCTANVILRDRGVLQGQQFVSANANQYETVAYDPTNVDHFWAANVTTDSFNTSHWLDLNGGTKMTTDETGHTLANGFGYGNRSDGTHVAAHCTQRKPLWSPLLQSCSYTANYNSWPPSAQISAATTYLDDVYITTSIASAREDMETCLEEVRAWFDPMWTHYALCRRGEGIGNDQNLCKSELEEWESAVCVYLGRQEELCGWLEDCLNTAKSNCESEKTDIEARVAARKVDYESSQRIECLLEAVTNFGESCVCDGLCTPKARFEAGYTQSDPDETYTNEGADLGGDPNGVGPNGASVFDARFFYDTPPTADTAVAYTSQPTPWTLDTNLDKSDNKFRTYDELMAEECQTYYRARKQEAIDRCMVAMPDCNPQSENSNTCPEGFIYDTYDGTAKATVQIDTDSDGTLDSVANPSLGWMLDTFGFPSRFHKVELNGVSRTDSPSYKKALTNVVTMTCSRSRLQMTACVNGIYDLPDGATTYENGFDGTLVDVGNHMEMQDRLYKADLERFLVQYGTTVMGTGWEHLSKIRKTILDDTPPATDWDVLSGSTNVNPTWCNVDDITSAQAGDVCSQADSRSPAADNTVNDGTKPAAGKPNDADCSDPARAEIKYWYSASNPYAGSGGGTDTNANGEVDDGEWASATAGVTAADLCAGNERNIGKIHMDTSIWDITPDCSMVHDQTENPSYTLTKDECPEFNQCSGPDRVSWDPTKAVAAGRNSPLKERYFWQVPSKVEVQTQMSGVSYDCESVGTDDTCNALSSSAECGSAGPCDATYSRIYLAANPTLTGSNCKAVGQMTGKAYFFKHYLKDDGSDKRTSAVATETAADHLVCRDGAGAGMDETFWRHHYAVSTDIFSTEQNPNQQNCDQVYGGPSDDYAKKLAGWLHYRRGSTLSDGTSIRDSMVGKHCFKTNPCAGTQQLVPFHTAYPKVECDSTDCAPTTPYVYSANNKYYCEDAPTTAYPFNLDGTPDVDTDGANGADVASSCTGASCLNEQSAYNGGFRG